MSEETSAKDLLRRLTAKLESAESFRRALETERDPGYYARALEDYDRRIEILRRRRRELMERQEDLPSLIQQTDERIANLRKQVHSARTMTAMDRERKKLDKVLDELSKKSNLNHLRDIRSRVLEPEDFLDTLEEIEPDLESMVELGILDTISEHDAELAEDYD
jgi:SMC interacting uncharacterized protein involved in chromosome segregation